MGNLLIDFTHNIVPTGTMYVFELLCFTWHSPTGVQGGISLLMSIVIANRDMNF